MGKISTVEKSAEMVFAELQGSPVYVEGVVKDMKIRPQGEEAELKIKTSV